MRGATKDAGATVKQQKTAARAHSDTRTPNPPPKRTRDSSPRHSVLLDRAGNVVRRLPVPRGNTFLLNVRDGHYYDAANTTTFVRRVGAEPGSSSLFLRVPCPVRRCDAWPGWACGNCHADPIHRSRIVAALKAFGSEKAAVRP